MSVITKFSDLDLTKQYTYADYLLWQFSERVELIRGFIKKMSPAPSRLHQTIAQNLSGLFYTKLKKQSCNIYFAPFDVRLPIPSNKKDITVVQPDLCVVCDHSKLDDHGCNGAPDLIIEILSPNNSKHDLDTKFNLYQEAGVLEYWIVEPVEKMLLVYTLINDKYIGLPPQIEGQNIKSLLFPDLKIEIKDVFETN
jgi:Uma2 family endonuclease